MGKLTDTTPDPITAAREALPYVYHPGVSPELWAESLAKVNAAFDYAEKLKAERDHDWEASYDVLATDFEARGKIIDELETEIARLTSQLEQAERVIAPFMTALKTIPHEGLPDDWRVWQTLELSHLRNASQWIKDRQAKGEG